ncbi:MAG: mechanosensitive ion channel [Thermodesulfobacteriota bacterium]|nr:mechanosensitive ion channel [Thermodesulfobacteriota bacterium]
MRKPLTMIMLFFMAVVMSPSFAMGNAYADEGAVNGTRLPATAGVTGMDHSISESLASEKAILADIEAAYNRARKRESALAAELENYQFQHTTYANLAALSQTPTRHLENASFQVKISLINIRDRLDELKAQLKWMNRARADAEEQLVINKQYLSELSADRQPDQQNDKMVKDLKTLVDVIQEKSTYLGYLNDFYAARVDRFVAIHQKLKNLSQRLDTRIGETRQRAIFQRTGMPLAGGWEGVRLDLKRLPGEMGSLLSMEYFRHQLNLFWRSSKSFLLTLVPLLALLAVLAVRLYPYRRRFDQNDVMVQCPVAGLALSVFRRSIYLVLLSVILVVYMRIGNLYATSPLVGFILALLLLYLFTRWGRDAIAFATDREIVQMPDALKRRLDFLLIMVRLFGFTYIVVEFLLEADSELLSLVRLIFEIALIGWCLSFWEMNKRLQRGNGSTPALAARMIPSTVLFWLIGIGGFVCEVTGYGFFAMHWYVSWGKTLVLGLWAVMIYAGLRQMSRLYQIDPDAEQVVSDEDTSNRDAPVRWLLIKIGQVALCVAVVVAIVLAWGGKRTFLLTLFQTLKHPFKIGNLQLSVMGFVYSLVVLVLTHMLVQAWRYVFQRKILARSGMEMGLQESLVTISGYLIWALGVLVALHVIGFNTTSLAVAFGALGIGLGFGLQNIFNNFVSGIILLFERPIQVGDDIEVTGTWATVKKINVRSTVVQTYDNASLIIPNSELISKQVTNWSFKDKRLRRSIEVGVAYGSDIERVRETLMEVAANTPRVLKYPKPDVVFRDFGDSALIFRLRVWTNIAYFYMVETAIRFEIDRLFRERNIVIAFPQRDVHVYHDEKASAKSDEKE